VSGIDPPLLHPERSRRTPFPFAPRLLWQGILSAVLFIHHAPSRIRPLHATSDLKVAQALALDLVILAKRRTCAIYCGELHGSFGTKQIFFLTSYGRRL
jgi:hypothetical protein